MRNNYYWPGTAYTNWIGVDAYNGGCNDSWYGSFADTLNYSVNWLQAHAPNTPVTGRRRTRRDRGCDVNAKADFFNGIPSALTQPGLQNIRAILYWNDKQPSCDFRVNSSAQSFDAIDRLSLQPMMMAKAQG